MLLNNVVANYNTDLNNMKTMSAHWVLFFFFFFLNIHFLRKLAKKRKETLSSTRQEMTVMVNSMDKSYTEQGTNCDEAFSFMDTHNLNGRCKFSLFFFSFWKVEERCKWFLKYSSLLSHGRWKIHGTQSFPLCSTLQCVFGWARQSDIKNRLL